MEQKLSSPLPKAKLAVICLIIMNEAFAITCIFPFLNDMVEDFKVASRPEDVGYYAGLIASSFNFCQFLSAFVWGWASDRLGRRPMIVAGLLGNVVAMSLFGVAETFTWAVLARGLNGLLNGNVGVAKTYLSEITDQSNSHKGFAMIGLGFGIGSILGPTISGFTASPTALYPNTFPQDSFWHHYPYLVPAAISALASAVTLVMALVCLDETLVRDRHAKSETVPLVPPSTKDDSGPLVVARPRVVDLLRSKDVVVTCTLYSLLAFTTMIFEESFSLWSVLAPADGGIGFGSRDIGITFAVAGVTLVVSQALVFPLLCKRFRLLSITRAGTLIRMPMYPLFPVISLLAARSTLEVWLALVPINLVRALCTVVCFTIANMFINNSAPPGAVGTVNGLGQSSVALVRAAGPVTGLSMFAWSRSNGHSNPPLNVYFVFFVMAVLALAEWLTSLFLSHSINLRKLVDTQQLPAERAKKPPLA